MTQKWGGKAYLGLGIILFTLIGGISLGQGLIYYSYGKIDIMFPYFLTSAVSYCCMLLIKSIGIVHKEAKK